ncbi:MAG TPA: hypothetical protein VGS80_12760 [Ktedonobacterales bacterium]|nr:hypothetical protein [Ktedonobacterales bacterium]
MRFAPSPDECAEHAASIREIPQEQFPDAEARAELVRRALAGCDVYAYRPAFQPEYVVWVRQGRPDIEARFDPMEWARQWHAGEQPIWPAQRPETAEEEARR